MKILFLDSNISEDDTDSFTIEMDVVPRVGDSISIDIDLLPEYIVEYLDLAEGEIPAVEVYICAGKRTIYTVVEIVRHVLLSTGNSIEVNLNMFARAIPEEEGT